MKKGLNTSLPPGSSLPNLITITSPSTEREWRDYYHVRWQVLREPWGQPPGSERDEYENKSFHAMAINHDDEILGVGRLTKINPRLAQIRYMAVISDAQRLGIGSLLLKRLEHEAMAWNIKNIKLNARDSHLGFYVKHGYQVDGAGHTLFNVITHTKVFKRL